MKEVKNKALYEVTRAFVVAAMRSLVSCLDEGESVPSMIFEQHTIEGEHRVKTDYVEKPMFDLLIFSHSEYIQNLSEYHTCVSAMREDPIISKQLDCPIGSWDVRIHRTAWEYLAHLLERQMAQSKPKFNSEIFDRMYSDLEQFFYNETIPCRALSPLHNLGSDVDRLEIEKGLRIRRLNKGELEELLDDTQLSVFNLMSIRYAIEFDYETKKELGDFELKKIPRPDINPWEKIDKLIASLRLFKQGSVLISGMKTSQTLDVPTIVGRTSGARLGTFIGQTYELKEAELNDFKHFWKNYGEIDLGRLDYLRVAIRRLNYAYERGNLEDKLIDYMVAFEALFFKEGETGEFRHKLSVRVSRFLEQEYDKRKVTAERIGDFYDKRSKVVHGEKVELKSDYINAVEDYLRRSIRLFLERLRGSDHNEIISHLDLE